MLFSQPDNQSECLFRFRLKFCFFLFRFSILCVFCFSLDCFVLALFAFVVFGLVSSVLSQEVRQEERLGNNLFSVDVKPYLVSQSRCLG